MSLPTEELVTVGPPANEAPSWYKDGVFYEVHVRAFKDGNGDGVGDFRGLLEKLDYLHELGVTAIWLLPFYPSPLRDDGYDISDYRRVHPAYGTLQDFRRVLREAHRLGMKVITELVLAHTSDEHPWFQRARKAPAGSLYRDFYVWSATPDRFSEARVIFTDYESSNWTFDPVAQAYYWHRFYTHQPSLNYDNPAVRQAIFDVVDHWLMMGVDGLRLDAVPYLFAREHTSCENLPETFEFLRELRAHIDERFEERMLLAEANQWPEDAVAYMGKGDMCHMAFHFPLMPRMFMAARQEDRFPIVDILAETPTTPPESQWALFLRNHDELTLEMVTDEERDYMYRAYAQDPQARVNVGIRRRLAPLLGNDRKLIEMMNGLLFSMPGTPIIYYGDEIGMGDNIYLGDRNAVRTPMQWDSDRNAGFSSANPQRLYLPVIIDPEYHAQAINVAAQQENPNSLLWWMKRMIGLRQRYRVFGEGALEVLRSDNRKVFSYLRLLGDEQVLVVVNLSRFAQCVELDLSKYRGKIPVELFGNQPFPAIGDLPYFITLGPHGFYWFSLERERMESESPLPVFSVPGEWQTLFSGRARRQLQAFLPRYIAERRWFAHKTRKITSATVVDTVPVGAARSRGGPALAQFVVVRVELDFGESEHYALPLGFAPGEDGDELCRWHPESVLAELHAGGVRGVLYDAIFEKDFTRTMVELMINRRTLSGAGRIVGVPTPFRRLAGRIDPDTPVTPLTAEQSNSSVNLADRAIFKLIRRFEPGVNPGVELGRFLGERAHFSRSPRVIGSIEYQPSGVGAAASTVAVLEEFVPNEGDGWSYLVDALVHGLEDFLATSHGEVPADETPPSLLAVRGRDLAPGHPLVGPHVEWASLLGRRTAELHHTLASDPSDPDFAPEPLTAMDRQAMFHGARVLVRRALRQAAGLRERSALVNEVLGREAEIVGRLRSIVSLPLEAERIRCHGDFHLGQVLWTGKDFMIIDFEGEPTRSIGQRRLKRPAAADLAGMIRSLHYASRVAALQVTRELPGSVASVEPSRLESWLTLWYRWVAGTYLASYLEHSADAAFLPEDRDQLAGLLDFFLIEKAIYELSYEANSRPDWVEVPALGLLDMLETPP